MHFIFSTMPHLATLTLKYDFAIPMIRLVLALERSGEILSTRKLEDEFPFQKLQATIRTTLTIEQIQENTKDLVYPQHSTIPILLEEVRISQEDRNTYMASTSTSEHNPK